MNRIILLTFFLFASFIQGNTQDDLYTKIDSLPKVTADSVKIKKKRSLSNFLKKDYPSPKKAVLLAIVPGMGQIYNKKYWKLPLVYGALGGVIYAIRFNTNEYNKLVLSLAVRNGTVTDMADPFAGLNIPKTEGMTSCSRHRIHWPKLLLERSIHPQLLEPLQGLLQ